MEVSVGLNMPVRRRMYRGVALTRAERLSAVSSRRSRSLNFTRENPVSIHLGRIEIAPRTFLDHYLHPALSFRFCDNCISTVAENDQLTTTLVLATPAIFASDGIRKWVHHQCRAVRKVR